MFNKVLMKYCLSFVVLAALITPVRLLSKDISVSNSSPCFIKNVGQITDIDKHSCNDIDYKLSSKGISVFIGNGSLRYQWYKELQGAHEEYLPGNLEKNKQVAVDMYGMDVELLNANKQAIAITEDEQPYHEKYYLPYCNGKTAHSYRKITYRNIYPNIDWVLYTNSDNKTGFKYDFIVHPGGKVSDIKMRYKGSTSFFLHDGEVHAETPLGNIVEHRPYTFNAATKEKIPSAFVLDHDVISFDVNGYDDKTTLVIDPSLNWCTYFFGTDWTVGRCIAADTFGQSYICGNTTAYYNIHFYGYKQYYLGEIDGFVAQFNDGGNLCNWATYFGGEHKDIINTSVCDRTGNLYIAGYTYSNTWIVTPGADQTQHGMMTPASAMFVDSSDGFLTKLDKDGALLWSTYVGGALADDVQAIACDNDNNVYIGGFTNSTDSIATTGAFQSTKGEGYMAKYNSAGAKLWGTYYNGRVTSVRTDNRANVFIGGSTGMYTGIATTGAYASSFSGFGYDGFIAKFSNDGKRKWGTYCEGYEVAAVACDSLGNVYGAGKLNGGAPSGIWKVDSFCKKKWFAGTDSVNLSSIILSPDNRLYFGGFRTTGIPPNILSKAVLGRISREGKIYYLNTWSPGQENTITVAYNVGKIYLGGYTTSKSLGYGMTWQRILPSWANEAGFIMQFQGDTNVFIKFPYVDTLLCAGDVLNITYDRTNQFKTGNTFTAQLSNASGSFTSPINIGSISSQDKGIISCTLPASLPEGAGYMIRIIASAPADTFDNYLPVRISHYPHPTATTSGAICANLNLTLLDTTVQPPDTKYTWQSPDVTRPPGTSNPNIVTAITLTDSGDYILVEDNHTCIRRDTIHVHVTVAPPDPAVTGDTSLCIGDTLRLVAGSPVTGVEYGWFDPANNYLGDQPGIEVDHVSLADAGKYRVAAILNGCQSGAAFGQVVTVHPLPRPSATGNSPVCQDDTLKLSSADTTIVTYKWSGPDGFTASRKDTIIAKATVAAGGVYTIKTTTIHGCVGTATTSVTIKPSPVIEALSNSPVCEHDDLNLSVGNGSGNASYSWTGPGSYTASTQTAMREDVTFSHAGIYKVIANLDGCKREATTVADIKETPAKPKLSSNSPVTTGDVIKLNIDNAQSNAGYSWSGPNGFISQLTNPAINNAIPAMSGKYTAIAKIGLCTSFDTITIVVNDAPGKTLGQNDIQVYPNPNNGVFTIKGTTKENNIIDLAIFASDGRRIYEGSVQPANNKIDETINIGGVANGIYRLKLLVDGHTIPVSFTVNR